MSGSMRVKRSVSFRSSLCGILPTASSSVKFVVSTTSVSPSKRPTDDPMYWRTPALACARPSSGMTRVSCSIS